MSENPLLEPPIDWALSIRYCNNSPVIAKELISAFINDVDSMYPQIQSAHAAGDLTLLYELVHKLQGGCYYCGVPKLAKLLASMEALLKSADVNLTLLNSHMLELQQEIERVLSYYAVAPFK